MTFPVHPTGLVNLLCESRRFQSIPQHEPIRRVHNHHMPYFVSFAGKYCTVGMKSCLWRITSLFTEIYSSREDDRPSANSNRTPSKSVAPCFADHARHGRRWFLRRIVERQKPSLLEPVLGHYVLCASISLENITRPVIHNDASYAEECAQFGNRHARPRRSRQSCVNSCSAFPLVSATLLADMS